MELIVIRARSAIAMAVGAEASVNRLLDVIDIMVFYESPLVLWGEFRLSAVCSHRAVRLYRRRSCTFTTPAHVSLRLLSVMASG